MSKLKKMYVVFFQLYGKKLKTIVDADSAEEARQVVKDKIVFKKVEECPGLWNGLVDSTNDILEVLGVDAEDFKKEMNKHL